MTLTLSYLYTPVIPGSHTTLSIVFRKWDVGHPEFMYVRVKRILLHKLIKYIGIDIVIISKAVGNRLTNEKDPYHHWSTNLKE